MVSLLAIVLLGGLVASIVAGGTLLTPASSGQPATDVQPQATDNLEALPLLNNTTYEAADEQEVEVATSTVSADIDGDGLDERAEIKHGTSPTNPNTDGDRYRDNEDAQPLLTNSAKVNIIVSNLKSQNNFDVVDSGMLDQEALSTVTVDMVITNDGDDYASFVKFDGVFLMDGIELKRATKDIGRIDAGESLNIQMTYTLRMLELPRDAVSEIQDKINENVPPAISFEIRNLAYEKF